MTENSPKIPIIQTLHFLIIYLINLSYYLFLIIKYFSFYPSLFFLLFIFFKFDVLFIDLRDCLSDYYLRVKIKKILRTKSEKNVL